MTDTLLPPELIEAARRVIEENRAAGRRVAVAESCTGGLLAALLTDVTGLSHVFERGFVTYSDRAKCEMLGRSAAVFFTDEDR